ncbi:hypothetical protein VP01_1403g2 [Puccinia sorghi]|uniref:Uncharacterized protein n=1 Tax=Puccinia sorghi TaxID=27349 RepID=A0A0L6VL40_9BASI|nr:hypothetical protein VP01_1403g2 [Puccinia sorghi]
MSPPGEFIIFSRRPLCQLRDFSTLFPTLPSNGEARRTLAAIIAFVSSQGNSGQAKWNKRRNCLADCQPALIKIEGKSISMAMAEANSNHEILYDILGGLQPGGTCLAWISGLVTCEALRLTQRFGDNTSWIRRLFVYVVLFLSVALARFVSSFLLHHGRVGRCKFMCIISFAVGSLTGFAFYSRSVWSSPTGQRKIFRIPIIRIIMVWLNVGLYFLFIFRAIRLFRISTFEMIGHSWMWERPFRPLTIVPDTHPLKKLGCGAVVTLIKAYDLLQSDAISKVLMIKGDPFRSAWGVLCLLCQTAIFPTIFDAILVCLKPQDGRVGTVCSVFSLSAEFHLFGPIMAISAALDDDPAECSTPCPVRKGNLNVGDAGRKHISFQSVEKKVSN